MQQTCGQVEYKNWDGEPKGSPGQPKSMQVWLADLRTSLDTSFSDGLGWFVHFPRMQVSPSIKLEWWSPALDSWWWHERVKPCFPAGLGTCWCPVSESFLFSFLSCPVDKHPDCLSWVEEESFEGMKSKGKWGLWGQGGGCRELAVLRTWRWCVCDVTLSGEMGLGILAFSRQHSPLFTPKMSPS